MESHVTGSGAPARVPFPQDEILVKHPLTGAMWNITPLLELIHELGDDEPGNAAQAVYDTSDYLTAEQNSPRDTAARLRQVLRVNNAIGAALDTVDVFTRQPA